MPVVAILCENPSAVDEGPFILLNIAELPNDLSVCIQERLLTIHPKYSKTLDFKCFSNNCPQCGIISGDFHLRSEPGTPFFPTEQDEAARLAIERIPKDRPILVRSECHYGTGDLILIRAKTTSGTNNCT
jgi:hypothetical protein